MKTYDFKHIAYHTLIALYFLWLIIFTILLAMAINNYYTTNNAQLDKILLTWISLNVFMGTALFMVLRQFRKRTRLARVVFYTYVVMVSATLTTVLIVTQ